jgi:hypothetical protein
LDVAVRLGETLGNQHVRTVVGRSGRLPWNSVGGPESALVRLLLRAAYELAISA